MRTTENKEWTEVDLTTGIARWNISNQKKTPRLDSCLDSAKICAFDSKNQNVRLCSSHVSLEALMKGA